MSRTSKLQKIHYHYKKGYIYLIIPVLRVYEFILGPNFVSQKIKIFEFTFGMYY